MLQAFSLSAHVFVLTGLSTAALAGLPIPKNPQWKSIVDEVYLQEVSNRIETKQPLLAVAVLKDTAYVGNRNGVYRVKEKELQDAACTFITGPIHWMTGRV